MLPVLNFIFCTTVENTIFWVIENIFHSGLDGTMILYAILLVLSHKLKIGELLEKHIFFNVTPLFRVSNC
jgi:hypothetical protein